MNIKLIKLYCLIITVVSMAPAVVYAGVYFISRDDTPNDGNHSKPCYIDYPLYSCSGGKVPSIYCPTDNRYFKHCVCDAKYKFTSCSDNKTPSGASCDGKFEACTCNTTKYKWDTNNCPSPKQLSGGICDGKYETCGCQTEYNKTCSAPMIGSGEACDGKFKSCKCPTNYVTCDYGGAGGASKCVEEDGTEKWSSCKQENCPSGMVDADTYWSGKLKFVMNTTIGVKVVGSKRCITIPSCESFNYSSSLDCSKQNFVRCPFDLTKIYCPG